MQILTRNFPAILTFSRHIFWHTLKYTSETHFGFATDQFKKKKKLNRSDVGTCFFKHRTRSFKSCVCTVISSDNSSKAINLDRERTCTLSRFDFITIVYPVGARKPIKTAEILKNWPIQPEMEARMIKQPDITRNGPQPPSGNHMTITDNDVLSWKCTFYLLIFRKQ